MGYNAAMKTLSLLCLFTALSLSSCGKDPSPASSTSGQTATPSAQADGPVATATQTNTNSETKVNPVPAPTQPVSRPPTPGKSDANSCPVMELAGHFKPLSVGCLTDGKADKVDAAVPTEYLIASDGGLSGNVTLKVGAKNVVLTFPRNPDPWLDFRKNGTQCTDAANKTLSQRCPGVKDSSCVYTITARDGKLTAVYDRVSGAHTYECRSDLSLVQE
jgi:hypothetical protein